LARKAGQTFRKGHFDSNELPTILPVQPPARTIPQFFNAHGELVNMKARDFYD